MGAVDDEALAAGYVVGLSPVSFSFLSYPFFVAHPAHRYLPPPVLDILSDKQLEATKRAAMLTAALTWFFGHLPINALPLPMRPALLLLQTLVPYVGYIGTFISWSWSTIKSYDTGMCFDTKGSCDDD